MRLVKENAIEAKKAEELGGGTQALTSHSLADGDDLLHSHSLPSQSEFSWPSR